MCMDRVTTDELPKRGGWGWKSFSTRGKRLVGTFQGNYKPRVSGKWINEKDFRDSARAKRIHSLAGGCWYLTGWHIWLQGFRQVFSQSNARIVRFRKPVAAGNQRGGKVIVAKEMFILNRRESLKWLKERGIVS